VYDAAAGKFPAFLRLQDRTAVTWLRSTEQPKVFEGIGTAVALESVLRALFVDTCFTQGFARGQAARTIGEMA